jgi:hypothetical protein
MKWQKGDVVSIYDKYDKEEECLWILSVSKIMIMVDKQKLNWYKVYNINYGTTYFTHLTGDHKSLVYTLVSRENDQI